MSATKTMMAFILAGLFVLFCAFFVKVQVHAQTTYTRPAGALLMGSVCTTKRTATVCSTPHPQPVGTECSCVNGGGHNERGNVSH